MLSFGSRLRVLAFAVTLPACACGAAVNSGLPGASATPVVAVGTPSATPLVTVGTPSPSTPTPSPGLPRPTPLSSWVPHPADTACGGIQVIGQKAYPAQGSQPGAESCLATAAQRCTAAYATVHDMGVDTSTDLDIEVTPGGAACTITVERRYYFASGGGRQTVVDATCTGVTSDSAGLNIVGCGSLGDISIPPESTTGP
jgi:hypothetical protein